MQILISFLVIFKQRVDFITHINTKTKVYCVLCGVFVLTRTGINCTEIFIIFLLIKDSCCASVYAMASPV
jgi:hypothetical protein